MCVLADQLPKVTIGTPGQLTSVSIDTGSTELWVDPICANAGAPGGDSGNDSNTTVVVGPLHDPAICAERGHYDPSKSSSKTDPKLPGAKFTYGDSTTVTVNYVADTIDFGSVYHLVRTSDLVTQRH